MRIRVSHHGGRTFISAGASVSWEEAVHRTTGLADSNLGLTTGCLRRRYMQIVWLRPRGLSMTPLLFQSELPSAEQAVLHRRGERTMTVRQILLTLASSAVLGASALAANTASTTLYVRCGKLMSSASEPLKGPITMVVKDGKVAAIGESLQIPVGEKELDLSRYTVVPGFIDSHVHLWTGPYTPGTTPSYGLQALRAQKAMGYALKLGIVGVRVLGTDGFIDVALRDAIEEGTSEGPHILPAGHPLTIPAGHGDYFDLPSTLPLEGHYTPLEGFVNSPEDAEKAVHLQVKYGAKVIKMFASGGVGSPLDSPDAEQLSPEEMKVIVEQAHMDHLKVAAHDENLKAILDALHAGVDSLEHASELNKEAIDYMKANHVYWDPTVYIVDTFITGVEEGPANEMKK